MAVLILGDFFYGYDHISPQMIQLSEYIRRNDLCVILNLEGALTDAVDEVRKRGEHLRQSPRTIDVLKLLNVKGVTLANNHIYDFGEKGLADTLRILDENGIQHSGAGLTLEQACRPIVLQDEGMEYRFYAMSDAYEEAVCIGGGQTSGCAPIRLDGISSTPDSRAVAILHTGFEYNTFPMPRNIRQNHALIDGGAYGVICMHPHVVQPVELYQNKTIAYSLGNFYFSEFYQEFQDKKIKNKPEGYCNTGYGVVMNASDRCRYLRLTCTSADQMTIEEGIGDHFLSPERVGGWSYLSQCLKNRNNHNPILLGNEWIDRSLLGLLNAAYAVYPYVKKLVKH